MPEKEKPRPQVRPCLVCGQTCDPWQRNIDGTYAHDNCLYASQVSGRVKI